VTVVPLLAFREQDAIRWVASFGHLADGTIPWDLHGIIRTADGAARIASSAAMAVGIYIVTDSWGRVLYIGKVQRADPGAIRRRLACHHRLTPDWDAVWLLPLADETPHTTVRRIEAAMIAAYRPPLNIHHARRGSW
jgi:hypothetical protein